MEKSQYKTVQGELLLSYLKSSVGRHFTVADISMHFEAHGVHIGTATIYRQLEKLIDEGCVKKYVFDLNSPACFEYIENKKECGNSTCFHLKCIGCGTLIHIHCNELEGAEHHIQKDHGFQIDQLRTVFYGLCEDCQTKQETKQESKTIK